MLLQPLLTPCGFLSYRLCQHFVISRQSVAAGWRMPEVVAGRPPQDGPELQPRAAEPKAEIVVLRSPADIALVEPIDPLVVSFPKGHAIGDEARPVRVVPEIVESAFGRADQDAGVLFQRSQPREPAAGGKFFRSPVSRKREQA